MIRALAGAEHRRPGSAPAGLNAGSAGWTPQEPRERSWPGAGCWLAPRSLGRLDAVITPAELDAAIAPAALNTAGAAIASARAVCLGEFHSKQASRGNSL